MNHFILMIILIFTGTVIGDKIDTAKAISNSLQEQKNITKEFAKPTLVVEDIAPSAVELPIASEKPIDTISKQISKNPKNKGDLISIKYKNGDLKNILRLIARVSGINLVAGPKITGKVTIELNDVHWEQALGLVLSVNGYTYIKDGNIIRVITSEEAYTEPLEMKIMPINYAKVDEIIPSIKPLLTPERGKVQGDQRANILIITDTPSKIAKIAQVVARLDQATPQVLIECKFIEIAQGDTDTKGVDWSSMGDYGVVLNDMLYTFDQQIQKNQSKTFETGSESIIDQKSRSRARAQNQGWQYALQPDEFRLAIGMLMNDSRTKLISNPKIQTLDNKEATIRIAQTHYKPSFTFNAETGSYEINDLEEIYVGITLTVTPHINHDDYVTLDVVPEVSNLEGSQILEGIEVPITNIRQVKTRVSLKDRYTVAIGGLVRDDWVDSEKSVPYLSDLPGIGKQLFTWKSKELKTVNIVIFLTPTIIRDIEPIDIWDKQFKDMRVTPDGEMHNVISNTPKLIDFFLHENKLLDL